MPARIESRVVFPAPLGPSTASSSPGRTSSETSWSAVRSPNDLERPPTSSTGAARRRGARAGFSAIARKLAAPARLRSRAVRLLFIGDVVGKPGREGLAAIMPSLRAEHLPDLIVANGENAAGGVGITEDTAREIFEAGVDVITLGNHTYRH